jgi:hypothetical protein
MSKKNEISREDILENIREGVKESILEIFSVYPEFIYHVYTEEYQNNNSKGETT